MHLSRTIDSLTTHGSLILQFPNTFSVSTQVITWGWKSYVSFLSLYLSRQKDVQARAIPDYMY